MCCFRKEGQQVHSACGECKIVGGRGGGGGEEQRCGEKRIKNPRIRWESVSVKAVTKIKTDLTQFSRKVSFALDVSYAVSQIRLHIVYPLSIIYLH